MKRTSILCYHIYFGDKYVYGKSNNYISVIIHQFETFNNYQYIIIIINNILILCAANDVSKSN